MLWWHLWQPSRCGTTNPISPSQQQGWSESQSSNIQRETDCPFLVQWWAAKKHKNTHSFNNGKWRLNISHLLLLQYLFSIWNSRHRLTLLDSIFPYDFTGVLYVSSLLVSRADLNCAVYTKQAKSIPWKQERRGQKLRLQNFVSFGQWEKLSGWIRWT